MQSNGKPSLSTLFTILSAVHIPLTTAAAMFGETPMFMVTAGSAAIALISLLVRLSIKGELGDILMGVTLMSQVAMMVLALSGHPWQADAHMYFFASLALLSGFRSKQVILASAAFVAVHHVTLNFAASDFVYPGGPSIGRLTMHAVILIVETIGLWIAIDLVQASSAEADKQMQEAQAAKKQVEHEAEELKSTLEQLETAQKEAAQAEASAAAARKNSEAQRERARATQAEVVERLADGMKRLSSGDLTYRIETEFEGGYEELRENFNNTVDTLSELLAEVLAVAKGIESSVGEIANASDNLSHRTARQAASLEETAAAMDETTATVRTTAQHAKETNSAVDSAREDAEKSGEVVEETVDAMGQISKSASQISQIIGVIDEIAFQTNLLALNAGVEAARAGDAGRGFAVVASEVRALAQRSAEAAKEIEQLIRTSNEQVENGVALVGRTGETLQSISSRVSQISTLVDDICRASQEQSIGLSQVNTAVNQMDLDTQQNAAMVEETTAAGRSLASEARHLAELVARFRIDGSQSSLQSGAGDLSSQFSRLEAFAKEQATG